MKINTLLCLMVVFSGAEPLMAEPDVCSDVVQRSIQVSSYSKLNHGEFEFLSQPLQNTDVVNTFYCAMQSNRTITIKGAGWSFGDQFMPPENDSRPTILVDTSSMNHIEEAERNSEYVVLKVGAGVTWKQAISYAEEKLGKIVVPFDAPTHHDISIAGSIASHTHSRTSDVMGKYAFDYVKSLALLTPSQTFHCQFDADPSYQPSICAYVAGSYGRLGVITDIEIKLKVFDTNQKIITEVIADYNRLEDFVKNYVRTTKVNSQTAEYDYGVLGMLQWTDDSSCRGLLIGAKKNASENENSLPNYSFPAMDSSTKFNQMAYALGHRYSHYSLHEYGIKWLTPQGTRGSNTPFTWFFFQTIHPEARKTLQGNTPLSWILYMLGVDQKLITAHQTWFFPGDDEDLITSFIRAVWEMMQPLPDAEYQFSLIKGMVELQDLIRIPRSKSQAHPTYHYGGGHTYTLSLAVHSEQEERLAKAFFAQATNIGQKMGVVPYLLKETHMENKLLRKSSLPYFKALLTKAKKVDPDCIISTRFWERVSSYCDMQY